MGELLKAANRWRGIFRNPRPRRMMRKIGKSTTIHPVPEPGIPQVTSGTPSLSRKFPQSPPGRAHHYATLLAQRATHEGRVTQETSEAELAEADLESHIRDYIVILTRRTFRLKHSVAALDYHGLTHSGEVPVIASREDRRTLARQLIAGDAAATAAGLPPMANPSAAELQAVLTNATREAEEIIPADRDLQAVVEKIRAARPRATELVQEVLDELRHATRKLEPGTARDIMRSYGVTFEALQGEVPEPGDLPAEPETPVAS